MWVQVEVVQIESDDIATAIAEQIAKFNNNKLVIGASSTGGMFSRTPLINRTVLTGWRKRQNLSSKISECCPSFCTIYAVSKGKLSPVRSSDPEAVPVARNDTIDTHTLSNYTSSNTINSQPEWTGKDSTISYPPSPMKQFQPVSTVNHGITDIRKSSSEARNLSYYIGEGDDDGISTSSSSDITDQKRKESSFRTDGHSWTTDQSSSLNVSTDFSSRSQVNISCELEQLRMEVRHVQQMYAKARNGAIDASRKLNDLHGQRLEGTIKIKEISLRIIEVKELAKQEKARCEAAKREAEYVNKCAEKEAALRTAAEKKAIRDAKAREKLDNSLTDPVHHYQEFTWDKTVSATSSFSSDLRVGMGSNGTVYKCTLHHKTATVKLLHSTAANRTKQFEQELEILSKICHPNLLTLLGACPDRGCLVYEYMENGSLEERLFRKNNTPPIPWFDRYRIAHEVASALVFLLNYKPKPIIHRDLKPANILLDHNFVSKIGDVELSTTLHSETYNMTTLYKETRPVGTLCYIDPEYLRTGLVSPKSDVYAFGIVVLQLLTAKPAIALAWTVEMAIDDDRLAQILDAEAGNWPIEETMELAILALRCIELHHRERPDLKTQILPALDR